MSPGPAAAAAVLALALATAAGAAAQEAGGGPQAAAEEAARPGTGDDWIDLRLDDMDRYAARYRDAFVDEVARYLEAPRALVVDALGHGMRPGDVYYACALARASGRACRGLVEAWREDPGGGWPGVAERLGLALDDLHRRVRDDIRASYRRWARPDGHLAPRRGR